MAGAGFEESTLMGTYNVAVPNFGGKALLSKEPWKKAPLWEPITWQGQTLEGTTFLSKQSVAGVRGKARVV